jgi:hypothetical protein
MKRLLLSAILLLAVANAPAQTNVDPSATGNQFGWAENVGWANLEGDGANGVIVMPGGLSGFAWFENIGWVNFGNGAFPYGQTSAADFGVNHDGVGNLSGFAWGENVGWINFDTFTQLSSFNQHARYDPSVNRLRGYAWGENVGWINLDDATWYVGIVPPACADPFANTDADTDVDLDDFGAYQLCRTGVNGGIPDGCECFNRPEAGFPLGDNDIDADDLAQFTLCVSGPATPLNASCDD